MTDLNNPIGMTMSGLSGAAGASSVTAAAAAAAHRSLFASRDVAIVPGAVTFRDTKTLLKMASTSPTGTLAFVDDEQSLFVRTRDGWQYVTVSLRHTHTLAHFL